jgi:hypothetical protein
MTVSTVSLRITTLSINDTLYNVTEQNNTQDKTLGKMSSCITAQLKDTYCNSGHYNNTQYKKLSEL